MRSATAVAPAPQRQRVSWDKRKKQLTPYVLLSPAIGIVIWVLGFAVWDSIVLSMREYEFMILGEPTFVGLSNYARLFRDPVFLSSLQITIIFVVGCVALGLVTSTIFALALYRLVKAQKFFSALALIPFLISGVAVGVMFRFLFSGRGGLVNLSLEALNQTPVAWLSSPTLALIIAIIATVWQKAPVTTLIILAGLQNIDKQTLEAAEIDGAGSFQVFRRITFPLILPSLAISLIWMNFVAFSMFDIILAMTRGGPGRATEVMAVRMYYAAFEQFDMPIGAAILVILLAINVTVSLVVIKLAKI